MDRSRSAGDTALLHRAGSRRLRFRALFRTLQVLGTSMRSRSRRRGLPIRTSAQPPQHADQDRLAGPPPPMGDTIARTLRGRFHPFSSCRIDRGKRTDGRSDVLVKARIGDLVEVGLANDFTNQGHRPAAPSSHVRTTYSPTIPRHSIWIPAKNQIDMMRLANP